MERLSRWDQIASRHMTLEG
jgi:hypothetical protein